VRTIAIVNQKGGCGKTTTAINLASLYARRGLRTLLVDMDPQSHCAIGLGVPESRIEYSIGDALLADPARGFDASGLLWEVARNLSLAPSTMMLSALEAPGGGLHQLPDKDRRLERLLQRLASNFDRCLIDCPPTIGLLTFNALRAAREALIPVETGFFALRGAEKQWNTIQRIIAHIDRPIACHLLATLHKPQSQLAGNILAALRRQFAGQIVPVIIREHEELRAAASFGQPVMEYAPNSAACADFEALADWLDEHGTAPPTQIEVMPAQVMPVVTARPALVTGNHQVPSCTSAAASLGPRTYEAAPAAAPHTPGSRAAELARRVSDSAARAATTRPIESTADVEPAAEVISIRPAAQSIAEIIQTARGAVEASVTDAETAPMIDRSPPAGATATAPVHPANAVNGAAVKHLYGVRRTSRGMLFVQPGECGRAISIAGDFNGWSAHATPLRRNGELDVLEAVVPLPPGRYQYRLVIDGRWLPDSHNELRQINDYGELNSVVEVT
jgi:chromosome partitioning protein